MSTGAFPIGLTPRILEQFADSNIKASPELLDCFYEKDIKKKEIDDFFENYRFFSGKREIYPREDQLQAVRRAILLKRCVNLCPTSFGKSLAIFMQCLWHIAHDRRIVLIVPTVDLVEQFYNDIKDYCTDENGEIMQWYPNIHRISAKYCKDFPSETNIVITTWQSVASIIKKGNTSWMNNFDVYIQDEVHKSKSSILQSIANSATEVQYRTGWTGSLKSNTVDSLLVEGCFGQIKEITTLVNLMEEGVIANLKIAVTFLDYPQDVRQYVVGLDYNNEVKYLENYKPRNKKLLQIAGAFPTNGVILFKHIKHGQALYEMAKKMYPGRDIYLIHGQHYERNNVMYSGVEALKPLIEKEKGSIILANYQVFSTGISLKSITYVMFAGFTKAFVTVLQSIGRALRVREDKTKATLIDLVDDVSYKKKSRTHRSYSYKHFVVRYDLYCTAKLETTFCRIKVGDHSKDEIPLDK